MVLFFNQPPITIANHQDIERLLNDEAKLSMIKKAGFSQFFNKLMAEAPEATAKLLAENATVFIQHLSDDEKEQYYQLLSGYLMDPKIAGILIQNQEIVRQLDTWSKAAYPSFKESGEGGENPPVLWDEFKAIHGEQTALVKLLDEQLQKLQSSAPVCGY